MLDDHPLVRVVWRAQVDAMADMTVSGCFGLSADLIAALRREAVDVVILDYRLTEADLDGTALIRQLTRLFPGTRILVCSTSDDPATIGAAMQAGALGFLSKRANLAEYRRALRAITCGDAYIDGYIVPACRRRGSVRQGAGMAPAQRDGLPAQLTMREFDVLRCCWQGLSPTQISRKLHRSIKTISGHKMAACRKQGITSEPAMFRLRWPDVGGGPAAVS